MRCARCGNDNPESNRFCGMCGATLLQPGAAPPATPLAVSPPPAPSTPKQHAVAAPTVAPVVLPPTSGVPSRSSPGISGPSFLGLNDPPAAKPRRGSLSIDPSAAPSSRSLDYLLEDEEEPKGGGAWKVLLMVLALGVAGGFGYLRWKDQGLPWLGSGASKPTGAAPSAETSDSKPGAPESPSTGPAASPVTSPVTPGPAGGTSQANPAASSAPVNPQASAADATPAPASGDGANSAAPPSNDSTSPPAATSPAMPKPELRKPAYVPPAKPHAAIVAPKMVQPRVDPVVEAKRYLYGQNMPQNCDHGLRILKPLADQANTKAMIEMGALYSAGLCTPRDLPTAYRWFALALRKDPENVPLQADLQKLWGEMTQPERQLAIKLSQ